MRPHRFSRAFLFLLPAILLLGACSGSTWYRLTVDGLTFLSEEERSGSFEVNTSEYLYFLPDFGHYQDQNSVSAELQHGFLVEYPTPDIPDTGSGEIRAEIVAEFDINTGDTSGTLKIYLAEASSEDIYDNSPVKTEDFGDDDEEISLTAKVAQGDAAYGLLLTGRFRCGVQLTVSEDGSDPSFEYTVRTLRISVEARPFSFIP